MSERENYFEAHVTIEPVFADEEGRVELLDELCTRYSFRRAALLMQKRSSDEPERSRFDTFCTGRSYSQEDLRERTQGLVAALVDAGFTVWRYKIEYTIMDSMYRPELLPLQAGCLPDKYLNPRSPV